MISYVIIQFDEMEVSDDYDIIIPILIRRPYHLYEQ